MRGLVCAVVSYAVFSYSPHSFVQHACRTFGSRTIVRSIYSGIPWFGGLAPLPSLPTWSHVVSSFSVLSADTETSRTVRISLFSYTHNSWFIAARVVKYDTLCGFLFIGWSLHYVPFYIMKRQLFLHHYFPALYFAILLSCGVFDLVTSTLKPRVRLQIAAVLLIVALWNFVYLSPLAYGNPWTRKKCEAAKWFKTWDFAWCVYMCSYLSASYLTVGFALTATSFMTM